MGLFKKKFVSDNSDELLDNLLQWLANQGALSERHTWLLIDCIGIGNYKLSEPFKSALIQPTDYYDTLSDAQIIEQVKENFKTFVDANEGMDEVARRFLGCPNFIHLYGYKED